MRFLFIGYDLFQFLDQFSSIQVFFYLSISIIIEFWRNPLTVLYISTEVRKMGTGVLLYFAHIETSPFLVKGFKFAHVRSFSHYAMRVSIVSTFIVKRNSYLYMYSTIRKDYDFRVLVLPGSGLGFSIFDALPTSNSNPLYLPVARWPPYYLATIDGLLLLCYTIWSNYNISCNKLFALIKVTIDIVRTWAF